MLVLYARIQSFLRSRMNEKKAVFSCTFTIFRRSYAPKPLLSDNPYVMCMVTRTGVPKGCRRWVDTRSILYLGSIAYNTTVLWKLYSQDHKLFNVYHGSFHAFRLTLEALLILFTATIEFWCRYFMNPSKHLNTESRCHHQLKISASVS